MQLLSRFLVIQAVDAPSTSTRTIRRATKRGLSIIHAAIARAALVRIQRGPIIYHYGLQLSQAQGFSHR
jgi:hypothetical protein